MPSCHTLSELFWIERVHLIGGFRRNWTTKVEVGESRGEWETSQVTQGLGALAVIVPPILVFLLVCLD